MEGSRGPKNGSWRRPAGPWEALGGQYPTRGRGIRVLEASWGHLGAPWGLSWSLFGPSWGLLGLSWGLLGPSWGLLEPSWRPKADLKSLPKSIQKLMRRGIHKMVDFGSDFGSILEPSWAWKREPRQAKTGQDRKSKNVKKPLIFQLFLCLPGVENQSKIGQKSFPKIS